MPSTVEVATCATATPVRELSTVAPSPFRRSWHRDNVNHYPLMRVPKRDIRPWRRRGGNSHDVIATRYPALVLTRATSRRLAFPPISIKGDDVDCINIGEATGYTI